MASGEAVWFMPPTNENNELALANRILRAMIHLDFLPGLPVGPPHGPDRRPAIRCRPINLRISQQTYDGLLQRANECKTTISTEAAKLLDAQWQQHAQPIEQTDQARGFWEAFRIWQFDPNDSRVQPHLEEIEKLWGRLVFREKDFEEIAVRAAEIAIERTRPSKDKVNEIA